MSLTLKPLANGWSRILSATAVAATVAVAAYKGFLVGRLNVNWDEFYYLSFDHSQARGELSLLLQGAFVHLFSWLPAVGGEMQQIVAARSAMVFLLACTAWLIWRFGSYWLQGFPAFVGPF